MVGWMNQSQKQERSLTSLESNIPGSIRPHWDSPLHGIRHQFPSRPQLATKTLGLTSSLARAQQHSLSPACLPDCGREVAELSHSLQSYGGWGDKSDLESVRGLCSVPAPQEPASLKPAAHPRLLAFLFPDVSDISSPHTLLYPSLCLRSTLIILCL